MRCNGCALMPHLVHHVDKKCIVQPKIFKRADSKYLEGHLFQALPEHRDTKVTLVSNVHGRVIGS